ESEGPAGAAYGVHGRAYLSERTPLPRGSRRGRPLAADEGCRGAEGEGAGGRPVEPLPPRVEARRRTHEPGVRAALRDHGARTVRPGSLQLQRARYREHGDAGALRQRSAEEGVARAPPRGKDPLVLRDDRA